MSAGDGRLASAPLVKWLLVPVLCVLIVLSLVGAALMPEFSLPLNMLTVALMALGFYYGARRPRQYRSLSINVDGFRYVDSDGDETRAAWREIAQAEYVRRCEPETGQMQTHWALQSAAGRSMRIMVEWPDREKFASALAAHVPGFSSEALRAALASKGEGKWRCR